MENYFCISKGVKIWNSTKKEEVHAFINLRLNICEETVKMKCSYSMELLNCDISVRSWDASRLLYIVGSTLETQQVS